MHFIPRKISIFQKHRRQHWIREKKQVTRRKSRKSIHDKRKRHCSCMRVRVFIWQHNEAGKLFCWWAENVYFVFCFFFLSFTFSFSSSSLHPTHQLTPLFCTTQMHVPLLELSSVSFLHLFGLSPSLWLLKQNVVKKKVSVTIFRLRYSQLLNFHSTANSVCGKYVDCK